MGRGWCNWCCSRSDAGSKIPKKTLKEDLDDDDEEEDEDYYKVRYDNVNVKLLKTSALPDLDSSLQLSDSNTTTQHKVYKAHEETQNVDRQAMKNEIEQSLAASISDRATDEVLEALTRYRRGLGIADSPSILLDEPQTPDIVRSRSSHDADGLIIRLGRGSILPKMGLESPTATPHMPTKRRSVARKVRPQSVVENLSLGHIPDLLESPSSHRSSSQLSPRESNGTTTSLAGTTTIGSDNVMNDLGGDDECGDSITELPSASFQLQHLVKGRPKRAKTRAATRPHVAVDNIGSPSTKEIGEGLDLFFRPGSVTPTTLTPLISPTSEECSSLSFVDSPTMSRDGNGQLTSEETTPILEERRPIKLDRQSPLLKGAPWTTRSRSTDNLEKYSPLIGRKSPLVKMRTEGGGGVISGEDMNSVLKAPERENKMRSPSTDSIRSHTACDGISVKATNGITRTPIILQKPRPWSVVGNEPKAPGTNDFQGSDSSKTTPEKLDEDAESLPFSLSSNNVGVVPGAVIEKKSVRELAAGLNRLELPMKPQALPRTLLTSASAISKSASTSHITSTNNSNSSIISSINNSAQNSTSSRSSNSSTTTTTLLQTQRLKITSNNSSTSCSSSSNSSSSSATKATNASNTTSTATITNGNENNPTLLTKTIITENDNGSSISSSSFITNEIINIRNGGSVNSNITNQHIINHDISYSTNDNTSALNNRERCINGGSNNVSSIGISVSGLKRIAGKEISTLFEETLVEGLQRSSTRRLFRDTQYTKEDVVDL